MSTEQHEALHGALLALITKRREDLFRALQMKTADEWNMDPRNRIRVMSWSDFGPNEPITPTTRMSWDRFRQIRDASNCSVQVLVPLRELTADD